MRSIYIFKLKMAQIDLLNLSKTFLNTPASSNTSSDAVKILFFDKLKYVVKNLKMEQLK